MEEFDLEEYIHRYPCIKCGYCCQTGPCGYGKTSQDAPGCIFLEKDDPKLGTFKCGLYEEIRDKEEKSQYPMFGCGCSSPLFNNIRNQVLEKMGEKSIQL